MHLALLTYFFLGGINMEVRRLLRVLALSSISCLIFTLPSQAATLRPNVTTDGFNVEGQCTLRDAVESVNTGTYSGGCADFSEGTLGEDDSIYLQVGSYVLSLDGPEEDANQTGDLDILAPVIILGSGPTNTTLTQTFSSGMEDRLIDIFPTDLALEVSPSGGASLEVQVALVLFNIQGGGGESFVGGGGIRNELISGIVALQNMLISGNRAFVGGGILNVGVVAISLSNLSGNQAFQGGALSQFGLALIDDTTIDSNIAYDGGGIHTNYGSPVTSTLITNSTISRNQANYTDYSPSTPLFTGTGGGISHDISTLLLVVNSTISSNQATLLGGGVFNGFALSQGGEIEGNAVVQPRFTNTYFNSTIVNNQVTDSNGAGGGIYIPESLVVGDAVVTFPLPTLFNSLVAQNTATFGPDCAPLIFSGGFNLLGTSQDCTVVPLNAELPDQTDVSDVGLSDLQDNGGPTETHGLLSGSPAIDMGNNLPDTGCQAPDITTLINSLGTEVVLNTLSEDQRAFSRPIAVLNPDTPRCDVGAYEFQTFGFTVTKDDGLGGSPVFEGESFTYTINITNNGPGDATDVVLNDPLPENVSYVSANTISGPCSESAGTVNCELGNLKEGESAVVTIRVTAEEFGMATNIVTLSLNNPAQQALSQTAQVTTVILGGEIFGSGCALQNSPAHQPAFQGLWIVFGVLSMLILREKKAR